MSTFLAGLRSRRWLNLGVFALGVLAMVVAVATPLYARASAEHLLDQRTAERPVTETGLNAVTGPQSPPRLEVDPQAQGGGKKPEKQMIPISEEEQAQMLRQVTDLVTTDAADRYWLPPTTYLLSEGEYRLGGRRYAIKTYWRDGMCQEA